MTTSAPVRFAQASPPVKSSCSTRLTWTSTTFSIWTNAVRWQVYTALLVYVLLRFMARLSEWGHSFTRLFAVTRSALWERLDLLALLKSYGTASGRFKVIGSLNTAWLPEFAPSKI